MVILKIENKENGWAEEIEFKDDEILHVSIPETYEKLEYFKGSYTVKRHLFSKGIDIVLDKKEALESELEDILEEGNLKSIEFDLVNERIKVRLEGEYFSYWDVRFVDEEEIEVLVVTKKET